MRSIEHHPFRNDVNFVARSILVLLLAVIAFAPEHARAVLLSPVITNAATGRAYALLHIADWSNSELYANRLGGHLATVRSQTEQDWLYNTFSSYGGFNKLLWIGFNDEFRDQFFLWANGEEPAFTYWAPGEPNSASEPFVAMYYPGHAAQGRWNDWGNRLRDPISIPFHGIVEFVPGAMTQLVSTGSVWRYLDTGIDPGANWMLPSFNDNGWKSGRGQFGYGDSDEATEVSYGGDPNNRHITTYFRHSFVVANTSGIRGFVISILRDDGYVLYLNGTELHRSNMGGGPVTHQSLATGAVTGGDETSIFHATPFLSASNLVEGTNVLAVEIHQAAPDSSDLSFDAFVVAKVANLPPVVHIINPLPGDIAGSTRDLSLQAYAHDDYGVTNVTLFLNGQPVASSETSNLNETAPAPNSTLAKMWAVAADNEGRLATSFVTTIQFAPELVARGAVWKFHDTGVDLGSGWRALNFDDSSWSNGPAELGYGDNDEATLVSYGEAANKHITTYFRRTFIVPDPTDYTNLVLQLLADDGAIVYLNDVEVARRNMSAGEVAFGTLAMNSLCCAEEQRFFDFHVDPARLQAGTNIVAVEVHQSSPESSDMSFDLSLLGGARNEPPAISLLHTTNALHLAWTASQIGYVLESTDDLTPPVNWQPVSTQVMRDAFTHSATVTNLAPSTFFRLRRQ